MKSAEVAGRAVSPQVCHTQAGAAPASGQVPAGLAKAANAAAAKLHLASPGHVDRLAREMAQASVLRAERARVFVVEITSRHATTVAGYAPARPAAATSRASAAAGASGSSAASASGKGEWAFLDDPKLSIEDKLFMFMKLVMKKSDDELQQKMKEYQAGKAAKAGSGSSDSKKSSGGLFGVLKKVFPPLAALEKVIPALPDMIDKVATQLGPQLMGALMIPLGAPWAAPLVQKAASALLPAALSAIDGATGGASGSAGSSGTGGSSGAAKDENDERMQLLEIERMMQKTNQMFATISNILKATHDAAMTAVNNIR